MGFSSCGFSSLTIFEVLGNHARGLNSVDGLPNGRIVPEHGCLVSIRRLCSAMKFAHQRASNAVHRSSTRLVTDDDRLVNRNQHVIALSLEILDESGSISKIHKAWRGRYFKIIFLENCVGDRPMAISRPSRIEPDERFFQGSLLPLVRFAGHEKVGLTRR